MKEKTLFSNLSPKFVSILVTGNTFQAAVFQWSFWCGSLCVLCLLLTLQLSPLIWFIPLWFGCCLILLFFVFFFMTYFHITFCLYRMFHRISSESNIFMYVCFKKCVRRFPVWGVLCSLCVLVSFKGRRLTGNKEQTPVLLLVIQTVKPKARCQRRKLWPWESFTVLPRFMLQRGLLFKGTCLFVCLCSLPTFEHTFCWLLS